MVVTVNHSWQPLISTVWPRESIWGHESIWGESICGHARMPAYKPNLFAHISNR